MTSSTLDSNVGNATKNVVCSATGDSEFKEAISHSQCGELMYQVVVLSVQYVVYVAVSETRTFLIVLVEISDVLQAARTAPLRYVDGIIL